MKFTVISKKVEYLLYLIKLSIDFVKYVGLKKSLLIAFGTKKVIKLKHDNLRHSFAIRTKTSDVKEFHEVIMRECYKLNGVIEPKNIVDLGGNNGDTACYFASKYPWSSVIVLEPENSNFKILLKNTSRYKNIFSIKAAIWYKKDRLVIGNIDDEKWAFRTQKSNSLSSPHNEFETLTVQDLMKKLKCSHIDILKIDIEGSEKELFSKNYSEWLPKTKYILIEFHDRFKKGCRSSFTNAINKYNFDVFYQSGEQAIAINKDFK